MTIRTVVCLTVMCLVSTAATAGFEGISGSYCASRRYDSCCQGRIDDCSVPLHGTYCYCDDFCNRTRADDCCPDYWSHCLKIQPPAGCFAGGRYYNHGEEFKINCNKCTCSGFGSEGLPELRCERNVCLLDDNLISYVNSDRDLGWTAANYSAFWGKTLSEGITYRTGTLEPHYEVKLMREVLVKDAKPLPKSFDARSKWGNNISEAMDQGWCGASWAISTVAVASDRFAIMSGGFENVKLSAQQLLSCNDRGQEGCKGGHLTRAWKYIRKYGLVDDSCYPWLGGTATKCRLPRRTNLESANCKITQSLRTELYKVGPVYRIVGEKDIMNEIIASGPVQATMKVYQDFFSYKSGIYKKSSSANNELFGYHSVRIIGWGEEQDFRGRNIKFWIAVNSWGSYWGEHGHFRIVRGENECMVEDFVLAAWSKTILPLSTRAMQPNSESNNLI